MRKSGMKLLIGLLLVLLMSLLITTGLAFEPLPEEEVTVYVGQKVVVWESFINDAREWYHGLTDTLDTNIATAEQVLLEGETKKYKLVVTGVAKGTTAINWEYFTYSLSGVQSMGTGIIKITVKEKEPSTEPAQPTESTEKVTLKKLKSVKLKALSAKKLEISWKKLSKKDQKKIQKFQIEYSTDKNFKTGVKTKWAKKTKASCTIKGLKKNTKYWVRIRAYKKEGNTVYVSKWVTKNKKTKKK